MSSIFRDVFREVLWFLASFVLKITDYIYGIILSFFGLNLGDFGFIWNFYAIVLTVTGLFITFRIGVIIFRSFWDDSTMQKIGGTELINRVLAVGLVLSLVPVIMPMMSELASSSATILPTIISNNAEVVPSDIIIESGMANFSGSLSESMSIDLEEDEHAIDVITTDTINEKNLQGEYKYIPNTSNIFLMVILGGFSAYVFVFIAIQIVQRMVGLLMKIAIAPYALSGIIDPNDNSPSLWFRLCMSDFLTSYFQMTTIWIAMLFATNLPTSFGGVAKGIAFIGSIFAIMVSPSGIAQLLGNDTGAQAGMQMMQSAMMLGQAAGAGTRLAVGGGRAAYNIASNVGGATKTGAAVATYGTGRLLGGRSLNPANASGGTFRVGSYSYKTNGESGNTNIGGDSYISEPSTSYQSTRQSETSSFPGTKPVSSYVNDRGILEYGDGKTVRENTPVGRIQPRSRTGAMAQTFARHMYQRSAQRVFNSRAQRQDIKRNTSVGRKFEGVKESRKDYKQHVIQAKDRKVKDRENNDI